MITTIALDLPKTITAEDEDSWQCACGKRPNGAGFYTCDPTGREVEPNLASGWDGKLIYCKSCGLVMDQTTYNPATQTVAVIGRIQDYNKVI